MKSIPCSGPGCSSRRVHHERPNEERGQQLVEVSETHDGPAYCSLTCAAMDGAITLQFDPLGCVVCGFRPEAHPGKLCKRFEGLCAPPSKWMRKEENKP